MLLSSLSRLSYSLRMVKVHDDEVVTMHSASRSARSMAAMLWRPLARAFSLMPLAMAGRPQHCSPLMSDTP